jgi:hypothetical protein
MSGNRLAARFASIRDYPNPLYGKTRRSMSLSAILLIIIILLLVGAIPAWPHSRSWGYGPSGGLGLVLVILLVVVLLRGGF